MIRCIKQHLAPVLEDQRWKLLVDPALLVTAQCANLDALVSNVSV